MFSDCDVLFCFFFGSREQWNVYQANVYQEFSIYLEITLCGKRGSRQTTRREALGICTLGVRDSVVLNLSPRGTREEIVLTSNVKINFVRLNLPQGLQ